MATQTKEKILRVGVISNGRIVEERLIRTREPITVGQKLTNTIVLPSDAVPSSLTLFDVRNGKYHLVFTDAMTGRVSLRDQITDLKGLLAAGAQKSGSGWSIELDEKARGKLVVGDATILFQFVNAPPLRVLPQLPANMRGGLLMFFANVTGLTGAFLTIFLLSTVLQGGGVAYLVWMVPPPPRTGALAQVPDRFVQVMRPPEEPPEPPETEVAENDDGEGEPVEAEPTPVAEPEPQREAPSEPSQRTEETIREEARTQVIQESALGVLYASADGVGPALAIVQSTSSLTAADVINNQTARGVGGSGIVSSTGVGTSAGAEGEVGRAQIEQGGSTVAANAEVAANQAAEGVQVRVSIRGADPRTAGSGRVDSGNLASVLRQRNRDIQRCYERALARDPELAGRFMLEFTIGDDGRVTDARLPQNELGEEVGTCIVGAVRRWRFDAPEGGSVTVRRPYILDSGS